ncbi:MAG: LamG domain-containing protein [Saprospiraceae bacterium]
MRTLFSIILLLLAGHALFAQCENRALNFDGNGDYIALSPLPADFPSNSDFTVQMWFRSEATGGNPSCSGSFRRLFVLSGAGSRFEIGECGGLPSIFIFPSGSGTVNMSTTSIRDGLWHHLSVVRSGNNVEVFLDCTSIYTASNIGALVSTLFRVGHWAGGATPTDDWLGGIDEVKLWNYALPAAETAAACGPCLLNGIEPGLIAYWQLDQGMPLLSNISETQATDATPNGNHGTLTGFALLPGGSSNFICSDVELVYPNLAGSTLELRGQLPSTAPLLTEICDGEPVHFCLKKDGATPQPPPGMTTVWEYNDDGAGWLTATDPPFIGLCFVAPSVVGDCSAANLDGFVDRIYRASVTVTDPILGPCEYISDEYALRICCPISPATVSIAVAPPSLLNGTLCAGDTADFTVTLNSPDPFVASPGAATTIEWYQNGVHNPIWDNLTTFTVTDVIVGVPSICFEAKVTHCAKSASFQSCITVDPVPVCGKIGKDPLCTTLSPVSVCPTDLTCYTICPGDDASLSIATPFTDCNPQWQYSFDEVTWVDMGFSNSVQNTNELSGDWPWPGGGAPFYYRIACLPLSTPSGCEPCFSNVVRIEFVAPPPADVIVGLNQICTDDGSTLLSLSAPGAYTYTWYYDGLEVQSGASPDYTATKSGCYWVDISNGCQVTQTPWHCLDICETLAAISCPDPICVSPGMEITLDACSVSKNTCGTDPNTFNYDWSWTDDTGTHTATTCSIQSVPLLAGSTYTVTVTDPVTGCSDTATATVVPCQQ